MSATVYLKSAAGTQQAFYVERGVKLLDGQEDEVSFMLYGSALPWLGPQTEHVAKIYDQSYALEDTGYATWAPSTTASAIIATVDAGTRTVDMAGYEYHVRWRVDVNEAYQAGTTLKSAAMRYCASLWQTCHRRPDSIARIQSQTYNHNYCTTMFTASTYSIYYNKSGTLTFTTGNSYGIYASITAATFSSTTADSPTLTLKTPAINARCSDTYFSTASAAAIDQEASTIRIVGDLYRTPIGWSTVRNCYADAMDVYNNGIGG